MPSKTKKSKTQLDQVNSIQKKNIFITIWSLRILLSFDFLDRFSNRFSGFSNPDILEPTGLSEFYFEGAYYKDSPLKKESRKSLTHRLRILLNKLTKELEDSPQNDHFSYNADILKKALSLSSTDIELLRFAALSTQNNGFHVLCETVGELSDQQVKGMLAIILNIPEPQINEALKPNCTLISSGLLKMIADAHGYRLGSGLMGRLELPDNIRQALSREHQNEESMLQCFFRRSPEARLTMEDFSHLEKDVNLIQSYINATAKNKSTGVNVLIYGDPGTGKTELVRSLCKKNQLSLYEITMQNENDLPIQGSERFAVLRLSQKFIAKKKNSVLLFDEIEDVFPTPEFHFYGHQSTQDHKKAWINNLLEDNPVPTFWISNAVSHIDPSYLRRFDFVLKLRPLSPKVRLRILNKYLGHLPIRQNWLKEMANNEYLAPAIAENAAKIINHINVDTAEQAEEIAQKVINNSLEVMGLPKNKLAKARQHSEYSLDYLNADTDLATLRSGLAKRSTARICLYGAPGTGKTAFAHFLSEALDIPILVKRASDILSKWVGEAEKNIADMFEQAAAEDMMLLLDEADSFLSERGGAQQSWEITQVNELLVQMETFNGIFIASTNLMNRLDAASLRRFDFKIKFDYMKLEQRLNMFNQVLTEHYTASFAIRDYENDIMKLDTLTPGDFAVVIRQHISLDQKITPVRLLESLTKECKAKPNVGNSVGFV